MPTRSTCSPTPTKRSERSRVTQGPTLHIRRTLGAPPERVFAAWTQPDRMRGWMAPADVSVASVDADPRVDGAYRIVMAPADGEQFAVRGAYREVRSPDRLVFTWSWEEDDPKDEIETLVTLEFLDADGGTELVMTHERLRDETSRDRHAEGWGSALDKLERYVAPAK